MKKMLALLLAGLLLISMAACGGETVNPNDFPTAQESSMQNKDPVESLPQDDAPYANDPAPENDVQNEEPAEPSSQAETVNVSASDTQWKQFLADYEAWADQYVAFMEQYKADPTNLTLLADYANLVTETTEWAEKADEVSDDLVNDPEAWGEYIETLSRITQKIVDAAY